MQVTEDRLVSMADEREFDPLLTKYKTDPYDYVDVFAIHTGQVVLKVVEGQEIQDVSGEWQQIPGTALYEITRERNPKTITARTDGIISFVNTGVDGQFVEAGERLLTIKHPRKKREIIEELLKDVLSIFRAPETAQYYFALDIQASIEQKGLRSVTVEPGDEILTMSVMKRDTPVSYRGEQGIIHSLYFTPGITVQQGEPLLGVCPPEKLVRIDKIITRVKADWYRSR